jgi:biopolymer transport protein ExbD
MRHFPNTQRKRSRIELIPMIDVMMFLLVFFVLISINVIPALGLKTKIPLSSTAQVEIPPTRMVVTLASSGQMELDGVAQGSLEQLTRSLVQAQKTHERLVVIVNGENDVPLQRLVDVMDALKTAHIDTMTIAAKKR